MKITPDELRILLQKPVTATVRGQDRPNVEYDDLYTVELPVEQAYKEVCEALEKTRKAWSEECSRSTENYFDLNEKFNNLMEDYRRVVAERDESRNEHSRNLSEIAFWYFEKGQFNKQNLEIALTPFRDKKS